MRKILAMNKFETQRVILEVAKRRRVNTSTEPSASAAASAAVAAPAPATLASLASLASQGNRAIGIHSHSKKIRGGESNKNGTPQ